MYNQMWNNYGNLEEFFSIPYPTFYPNFQNPLQFCPMIVNFDSYTLPFFNTENLQQVCRQQIFSNVRSQESNPPTNYETQHSTNKIETYQREKDRNMISNSLKVFRKFASDSTKVKDSVLESIIWSKKLNYTAEQFAQDLDRKIPKQKNYLGIKFLNSLLCKKQKNSNFGIVFRILLNYYYKKAVYPTVLTSCKILPEAKKKQLLGVRRIIEDINMKVERRTFLELQ